MGVALRPAKRVSWLRRLGAIAAVAVMLAICSAARPTVAQTDGGGLFWPEGQVLPTFAKATHLDVVNGGRLTPDEKVMIASLQGLVNRRQPRIYLQIGHAKAGDAWLTGFGLPTTTIANPMDLLAKYHDEVSGIVVYDPSVPATIDVATTLAGLDHAVIASPTLASTLESSYHLAVKDDLRGRFHDDVGAYSWAFDTLWPRVTHRMIVAIDPSGTGDIRDYAVATGALTVWLRVGYPNERELLGRILDAMPPATPYVGWFSHEQGSKEGPGVTFLSEHSHFNIAAANFSNATVFGGVPAQISRTQPDAPVPPLSNKIYVTFTVSDGDNVTNLQGRRRMQWEDPQRGRVPINWSTNPLLVDMAPTILAYYQRTATPNDYLVTGSSGAGYTYISHWPEQTFHSYISLAARYMARSGMRVIVVNNGIRPQMLEPERVAAFEGEAQPLGIETRIARQFGTATNGVTPVTIDHGIKDVNEGRTYLEERGRTFNGRSPMFVSLFVDAWTMTPADLAQVASSLGPQFQVVRGDAYFRLLRQASGLPQR